MRNKKYKQCKTGHVFHDAQEQFLEFSAAKDKCKVLRLEAFWAKYLPVYHLILTKALMF